MRPLPTVLTLALAIAIQDACRPRAPATTGSAAPAGVERSAARAAPLELVPQVGHASAVHHVSFTPDGRFVVTAGADGLATVWDAASALVVRTIALGGAPVGLAIAPDGRTAYVGLEHGRVSAIDLATGRRAGGGELAEGAARLIAIALSADGRQVAASNLMGKVVLWDTAGWKARVVTGADGPTHGLTFSADGASLWGLRSPSADAPTAQRLTRVAIATGKVEQERVYFDGKHAGFGVRVVAEEGRLLFSVVDPERQSPLIGDDFLFDMATGVRTRVALQELALPGGAWARVVFTAAALGRDGRFLAGDYGGRVRLARFGEARPDWAYDPEAPEHRLTRRGGVTAVALSADGTRAAAAFERRAVVLLDARDGRELRALEPRDIPVADVHFAGDGKSLLFAVRGGALRSWDLAIGSVGPILRAVRPRIEAFAAAAGAPRVATLAGDGACLTVWSTQTGAPLPALSPTACRGPLALTDDGRAAVTASGAELEVWDVDERRRRHAITTPNPIERLAPATPSHVVAFDAAGYVLLVDVAAGRVIGATRAGGFDPSVLTGKPSGGRFVPTAQALAVSHDARLLVAQDTLSARPDGLTVVSGAGGEEPNVGKTLGALVGHEGPARAAAFSPDDRLLATGGEDATVRLWRMPERRPAGVLAGHHHKILGLAFSPDGGHLASTSADGTVRVWRLADGASVALLVGGDQWLTYSDDGWFDASAGGAALAGVSRGFDAYRVEQLAVPRNRPGRVLERLGLADPVAVAYFEDRYARRVAALGAGAAALEAGTAPTARVEAISQPEDGRVVVEVTARSRDVDLTTLVVSANQVPLAVLPLSGRTQRVRVPITLAAGENLVEVSARSAAGVESLRDARHVRRDTPARPTLHYLGLGVSRYRMRELDLAYAAKDARDLEAALRRRAGAYAAVRAKTLVDEQVTREVAAAARAFLAEARPDDTVVVFVAGHGVHAKDAAAEYYFVTHETDPARLSETALSFERLEGLLEGLSARRKLLLLDTCESGESDELARRLSFTPPAPGVAPRGRRGLVLDTSSRAAAGPAAPGGARRFLLDRDRLIFRDLGRRAGAIVLASSRGWEQSYELDALQNGAFTHAILEALDAPVIGALPAATARERAFYLEAVTDAERPGRDAEAARREVLARFSLLLFGPLRARVEARVAELTGGNQHPVVVSDNPSVLLALPAAPPAGLDAIQPVVSDWLRP